MPSTITIPPVQDIAPGLIAGMRVPPQIILRAADARPFELQDLIPSDTRFKILVFPGDVNSPGTQKEKLLAFSDSLCGDTGVLTRIASGKGPKSSRPWTTMFEVITVITGKKETANYTSVPAQIVSHWSKCVFRHC